MLYNCLDIFCGLNDFFLFLFFFVFCLTALLSTHKTKLDCHQIHVKSHPHNKFTKNDFEEIFCWYKHNKNVWWPFHCFEQHRKKTSWWRIVFSLIPSRFLFKIISSKHALMLNHWCYMCRSGSATSDCVFLFWDHQFKTCFNAELLVLCV